MSGWLQEVERMRSEFLQQRADPWTEKLERGLSRVDAISSAALAELIGVPATTGNARRIAPHMRLMGFIPIKSRRLMPGGYRGTTVRGWARPLRETKQSYSTRNLSAGTAVIERQGGSREIST
jgi:hypothetical protein